MSDRGTVVQVRQDEIKVRREGIKSAMWYPLGVWEPNTIGTEQEAFLEAIRERPSDYDRRTVYADILEEGGQPDLAAAYRWMARHRKRPEYLSQPGLTRRWAWYHPHYRRSADPVQSRSLEVPEHAKLPAPLMFAERCWMKIRAAYHAEEEAVEALAAGLKNLRSVMGGSRRFCPVDPLDRGFPVTVASRWSATPSLVYRIPGLSQGDRCYLQFFRLPGARIPGDRSPHADG